MGGGGVTYAPVLGRQAYIINIKCWHCYYIHHHYRYHNPHQLTAVSFVRTVGTVLFAVTHVRLLNTDPVCALPIIREALVLDWTTDKSPSLSRVFTFIVNVFVSLHFHTPVASLHSSLSSLSFVFVITFIQLLPATTVITYKNNQGECCSSLFHVDYCQLRPTLSSDALISIVSSFINIITSTDHHLFRSHLLSPALFLLIFSSGALFITWINNQTVKTHTIFSITKTGNQTRHRQSSASHELVTIQDTIFSTTGTGNYTRHTPSSASQEQVTIQDTQHLQDHTNW